MKSVAVKQTKDQIADLIRNDILSGVLKSGDELTQEQVAEQTGLSRMPVREAFQTLEQEGLLLRLPNRHMQVIEISDENIRQYFTTLVSLGLSFYQQLVASKHSTNGIISAIKQALEGNVLNDEIEVHFAFVVDLGNEYLLGSYKKLLSSFYLHALQQHWKASQTRKSLQTILGGVINSDESAIYDGLRTYFNYYQKSLLKGRTL